MPDAPTPTFNSNGQMVPEWLMVVRYDAHRDVVTLSWTQDGTVWQSRKQGAVAYPPTEVSDIQEGIISTLGVLNARRLF